MRLLMRLASGLLGLSMVLTMPALADDIVNWSSVDGSNNRVAPNGWQSGVMLPSQVEPTARAMMGAIRRFWDLSRPHALTNTALTGLSTAVYPNGVWRDDYATGNGAPPLFYYPSGSACSLSSGAGDNGSQVQSSDGKCWIARFHQSGADVREWGAKCDGSTNDSAAITAAQAFTTKLLYPNTNCVIATSPSTAFNSQVLITGGAAAGNLNVNNAWDVYNSNIQPFAQIAETSDLATGATLPTLGLYHKFGGTGAGAGGRQGLWVDLVHDGNLPTNANPFQTGIFSNVWAKSGTNGGEYYGYAAQVTDDLNLVHYGDVGGEIDLSLHQAGAQIKEGWGIASVPIGSGNDAFQGSNYSAGLGIWAGGSCGSGSGAGGSGCVGFNAGISFGRSDSYLGVSPTGSLIQTTLGVGSSGNMSVANGINAGNLIVTGFYEDWGSKYFIDSGGRVSESTTFPQFKMNDTNLTATTGGLVRLASTGSGAYAWQVNSAAGADFSTVNTPITLHADGSSSLMAVPVASLPTCNSGSKYEMFQVTDLSGAPTYRQTGLTGSGSVAGLVMCNGSAWEAH